MIELKLRPGRIPAGQTSELFLEVRNTGSGPCNHLIIDLRFPVALVLIKGSSHVELNRLKPGEAYIHPFVVRGKHPGRHTIHLDEFSYRGSDGRIHSGTGQSTILEVIGEENVSLSDNIQLQVSLQPGSFTSGEWSLLKGQVSNQSSRYLEGLYLTLEGPVECRATSPIGLPPGQVAVFEQGICFTEAGKRVGVKLRVHSPSGATLFSVLTYFTVTGKTQPGQGAAGGVIIQGSQVEITYGNRTQVSTGGDTVIVGSQIGGASAVPHCPGCGVEIKRSTRFCENCGTLLNK